MVMQSKLISKIDWDLEISAMEVLKPLCHMTDRAELESIIIVNEAFMKRYNKSHYLWPQAIAAVSGARARLVQLDRYVVKTPLVTPQLELFKGGYVKQY
jgi:hypothetical protein